VYFNRGSDDFMSQKIKLFAWFIHKSPLGELGVSYVTVVRFKS
jgi:hypothetical protein